MFTRATRAALDADWDAEDEDEIEREWRALGVGAGPPGWYRQPFLGVRGGDDEKFRQTLASAGRYRPTESDDAARASATRAKETARAKEAAEALARKRGENVRRSAAFRRVLSHAGPHAAASARCTPTLENFCRRSCLSAHPSVSIPTHLDAFQLRFRRLSTPPRRRFAWTLDPQRTDGETGVRRRARPGGGSRHARPRRDRARAG